MSNFQSACKSEQKGHLKASLRVMKFSLFPTGFNVSMFREKHDK